MIVRVWRGWIDPSDEAAYVAYIAKTGLASYRTTPGNRGAWIAVRSDGDRLEIVTTSLWETEEAIRAFAGEDIGRAVFYPEDDRFLIEREMTVGHYRLID